MREITEGQLRHALNYHSIDAKVGAADYQLAEILVDTGLRVGRSGDPLSSTQQSEMLHLQRPDEPKEPILRFFAYQHLPRPLREISKSFAEQAGRIMYLPRSAERTVALRKLLESMDAAVRAALPADE